MVKEEQYLAKKQAMILGGQVISKVVQDLGEYISAGIRTIEIDNLVRKLINREGVETSFDKVPGYHWATCLSINQGIVHGVPNLTILKKGDLLKLDIGVYVDSYHVDYGTTFLVDAIPDGQLKRFLDTGKRTLNKIIKITKKGVHIGKISQTINKEVLGAGYQVILDLTGHAVGKKLHEDPLIPQFLDLDISKTPKFQEGKAYALEIIYSMSDNKIAYLNSDGWSLKTSNNCQSACFENSVFIDRDKTIILVN